MGETALDYAKINEQADISRFLEQMQNGNIRDLNKSVGELKSQHKLSHSMSSLILTTSSEGTNTSIV